MSDRNLGGAGAAPEKKSGGKRFAAIAGGVVVILGIAYFAVSSHVHRAAEDQVTAYLRKSGLDRHLRYKSLDTSIFGTVTLHNVRLDIDNGNSGTVEAIKLSNIDIEGRADILRSIDIDMENFDIPYNGYAGVRPIALGFDALRGNLSVKYDYEPNDAHVSAVLDLALDHLGDVHAELRLNDFTLPATAGRMEYQSILARQGLLRAELEYAAVELMDKGLEDRILDYESAEQGMALPGDEYRDVLRAEFEKQLDAEPPKNALEQKIADVCRGFLSGSGGEAVISYQPEYPVSFADLGTELVFGAFVGSFGGLDHLRRQAQGNTGALLSSLIDRGVLKISFDS